MPMLDFITTFIPSWWIDVWSLVCYSETVIDKHKHQFYKNIYTKQRRAG